MRLYLFRHGPSENRDPDRWPDDTDRPLSRVGRTQSRAAATGFATLAHDVTAVVSSPAVRGRTTADAVHAALGLRRTIVLWDELAPGEPAGAVLEKLGRPNFARWTPVVVGHEPTLSEFIGLAVTGEPTGWAHVAKAGAAALEFPARVAPGAARLEWLLTRAQLSSLA
ncbi:MAG: histidine phosphatase family protein [Thermoplasmata archaeon]|nr:histidine phosphatase family protein [Thermoplasmata archaeon]